MRKQWMLIGVACALVVFLMLLFLQPETDVDRAQAPRPEYDREEVGLAAVRSKPDEPAGRVVLVPDMPMTAEGIRLDKGESVNCSFVLDQPGQYALYLEVRTENTGMMDSLATLQIADESCRIVLPRLWYDAETEFAADRFGNEVVPDQVQYDGFVLDTVLRHDSMYGETVILDLPAGRHTLTFKGENHPFVLRGGYLEESGRIASYDAYSRAFPSGKAQEEILLTVEGENYLAKSHSSIVPSSADTPNVFPYNSQRQLLNVLNGSSSAEVGCKVIYLVDIPADAWYGFQFAYAQSNAENMVCFREIQIDGTVPFAQMQQIPFAYTGYSFDVYAPTLEDGSSMQVYLTKGQHTLTLTTSAAPYQEVLEKADALMEEIRTLSLTVKKITGNSTDRYRTWNMEEFMPGISDTLRRMADEIDGMYGELEAIGCCPPNYAATLKVASANLRRLAEDPDELPGNMALFSDGTSSVSQRLATVSDTLLSQGIDLDCISLYTGSAPRKRGLNLLGRLRNEGVRFLRSFSDETRGYSVAAEKNDENLVVWMNRPLQHVTLLQQMVDAQFTAQTGISVQLCIMPSENKLVLANAADSTPDVALSVANQTPYNLGLRGAAYPVSAFGDFFSYVKEEYNLSAFSGLVLENEVYGMLETSDFYVMVYRKDILDALGLSVPETWDDVIAMMPKLQRYGMTFYTPIAGNKGTKYLHETTPYLFQAGAALLTEDGQRVDFTSEKAYRGFELMTDLYLKYSLSQDTPNFYNHFRYGTAPIGITNYGTYILLKHAAPEIAGQWEMALVPGTMDAEGEILRYQVAGDKCDMIFADSRKKEEAWLFLKWWLSSDVQAEYADRLTMRYGPEYFWNTANMQAFAQYPMEEAENRTILTQWQEHTRELQKHPATYMIEREISNVWSAVVVNGADLRTTLVQSETTVNREMQVKLKEFGYRTDTVQGDEYDVLSDEELLAFFSSQEGEAQ